MRNSKCSMNQKMNRLKTTLKKTRVVVCANRSEASPLQVTTTNLFKILCPALLLMQHGLLPLSIVNGSAVTPLSKPPSEKVKAKCHRRIQARAYFDDRPSYPLFKAIYESVNCWNASVCFYPPQNCSF